MKRISLLFVLPIAEIILLIFILSTAEGATQTMRRANSAKCADGSRSQKACDKKNKHCPTNNSCRYLPSAGAHKWWCCSSKHNSRTCPNSGLKPRNQHCLLDRANRNDGKKKKALFCHENEMCFKAWWDIANGYGLCCKAYICHDGTEASGACGDQCRGTCQKFKKYKKGIIVRGKFVKKCCGKKKESENDAEDEKREEPFGGEEQSEAD
uniref:Uncharacterized protein n=1 Tax=Globodera rostochiensis TaxID=31243 RepID=A0A914HDP5_GLORO